uniref:carbonyl reductase [NADPH] 1 isoform X1 n=1 Tax=Myxine glutinosa TaxID=7769 RepID=UPI00358E0986
MAAQRVAVVTGANKGIGFAIVQGLAKTFDGVVILTARNEQLGHEAVDKVASLAGPATKIKFHQLDITDDSSVKCLAKHLSDEYGGLDVLINNAGIAYKVADTTPFSEQAEVTLRTNFFATLRSSDEFMSLLRPAARVVTVSSTVALRALSGCSRELAKRFRDPELSREELATLMEKFIKDAKADNHKANGWPNSAYGMSKVGVTCLTRIQAREIGHTRPNDNILVNCCCPGWVRTDMAGPKATLSPEEGAVTPLYLAQIPPGASSPHGQFVFEKQVKEW